MQTIFAFADWIKNIEYEPSIDMGNKNGFASRKFEVCRKKNSHSQSSRNMNKFLANAFHSNVSAEPVVSADCRVHGDFVGRCSRYSVTLSILHVER